jgi:uncharacterized surface protein with fasciclin (FAS1) repeats
MDKRIPASEMARVIQPRRAGVCGKVMSGDLSNDMMVQTVQGDEVTIMTEGGVTVNTANVVTPDIEASNGVIHVIDAVIMQE